MIAKRVGGSAVVVLALILCGLGVSAIQGDCGGASILDRITASPQKIADEEHAMSAWLASSVNGRNLTVESISGHRLTLLDHAGSEPARFSSTSSRSILAAWVDVLQKERHLARPPVASIYIDFGGMNGTYISSHECIAP